MQYCPKCNSVVEAGDSFCGECGAGLDAEIRSETDDSRHLKTNISYSGLLDISITIVLLTLGYSIAFLAWWNPLGVLLDIQETLELGIYPLWLLDSTESIFANPLVLMIFPLMILPLFWIIKKYRSFQFPTTVQLVCMLVFGGIAYFLITRIWQFGIWWEFLFLFPGAYSQTVLDAFTIAVFVALAAFVLGPLRPRWK